MGRGFPRFKPQDPSPVLLQEHTSWESLPAAEMTRDITKHSFPVIYASVLCQAPHPAAGTASRRIPLGHPRRLPPGGLIARILEAAK